MKPVRTAVIGLGRSGWNIHVKALRPRKDKFVITDVVDPIPERRKQAVDEFGCNAYTDIKECLKKSDAELVIVASRSHDHAEHSIMALKAGKHVMCEKPIAMKVKDADKAIAAAGKAKKVFTIYQSRRHTPFSETLRNIIKSKVLGKLLWAKMHDNGYQRRWDWQTLLSMGGGMLANVATHAIDQMLYVVGSPVVDIWSDLKHTVTTGDAEDHVKVVMRTRSGVVIDYETSYACAIPDDVPVLTGTTGAAVAEGDPWGDQVIKVKYYDPKKVKKLKVVKGAAPERKYCGGEELPWQEKIYKVKDTKAPDLHDALFEAVRKRKKPLVTPESSREVLRILETCRKGTPFEQ